MKSLRTLKEMLTIAGLFRSRYSSFEVITNALAVSLILHGLWIWSIPVFIWAAITSSVARNRLAGNAPRDRILKAIAENPGIHGYALSQKTGIGSWRLYSHLYRLQHDEGLIVGNQISKDGRFGYSIKRTGL